ncbi:MAG: sulfate adenylyltransferase subunit CysD [Candidatus Pacebacteria bacterium]|nr:sulfate adenylyltransferase subunit CysD [Candidatus Paceibacterota bacterium]
MTQKHNDHLDQLESEAIFIFREAVEQFENPVLLFSGGKDSITLVHLAHKAFYPAKIPFSLLHIDTGHNFPETLDFRDELVKKYGVDLEVGYVQDLIDRGVVQEEKGINPSRNSLQSATLLEKLSQKKYDAAFGGGRRDEEKARAKERFFSHRDEFGQWDPKNQRPEVWNLFNGKKAPGESFRVFPISNWTETDVWEYIQREKIDLPSLYFAHDRNVVLRGDTLLAESPYNTLLPGESYEKRRIRYRTLGCVTITGAIESDADTIDKVIEEVRSSKVTERGTRADDARSEVAMEERKKQGYF